MSVLSHPKYRPDIDGLRAIAVLSVVIFHAFPGWLKGGFVGVDVFFVISGFLISTIIFENLDKGTFSFAVFYARRIRRIFPALLLVLLASFVFGWFALFAVEYKQLGKHIAAGAGFASNFVLWNESGYFDNASKTKPLLHLWSLGVEEQFYIIWPFLLWFMRKIRLNLLLIICLVFALSFFLNIQGMKDDAVAAFYSPQTRFWELLVGAILAYISAEKVLAHENRIGAWLNKWIGKNCPFGGSKIHNILSCFGAAALCTSIILPKTAYFSGWLVLLPTLGTAFIIAAGHDAWVNKSILSNRVLVFFGLISFPLYLWHWPILSFATIVESQTPPRIVQVIAVILSIALAWLTYRFIEKPIRFGRWGRLTVLPMMIAMVIVGCIGYETFLKEGLPFRDPAPNYIAQTDIVRMQDKCSMKFNLIKYCAELPKPGAKIVVFVGDSHVRQTYEIMKDQLSKNYHLIAFSNSGCPFLLNVNVFQEKSSEKDCAAKNSEVMEFIRNNRQQIKAIIMAGEYASYSDPGILRDSNNRIVSFGSALTNTLSQLKGINKIFVEQLPPLSFNPKICLNRPFRITKEIIKCESNYQDVMNSLRSSRNITREVLSKNPDVKLFNMDSILCSEDKCTVVSNNRVLYYNETHLNPMGVEFVKSKLEGSKTISNFLEYIEKDVP